MSSFTCYLPDSDAPFRVEYNIKGRDHLVVTGATCEGWRVPIDTMCFIDAGVYVKFADYFNFQLQERAAELLREDDGGREQAREWRV